MSSTRKKLLRLGAGTLLTLGLWPGRLRAGNSTATRDFTFIAVNDLHFSDAACATWFEEAIAAMKTSAPAAELCLINGDLADDGTSEQLAGVRDAFQASVFRYIQRSATMTTTVREIGDRTRRFLVIKSITCSITGDGKWSGSIQPRGSGGKTLRFFGHAYLAR